MTTQETPGSSSDVSASAPGLPGVRVVCWTSAGTSESLDLASVPVSLSDPEARVWIDLRDPAAETVEAIASVIGLHPLVAEDIVERNQRAKIETTDSILHMVMFALAYEGEAVLSEIDLVLGQRFLLTVHDAGWRPHEISGLRRGVAPVLAEGLDYLLWMLADAIVDDYFPVLDRLDEDLDLIQDDVVGRADQWTLERLFSLKRELIELRRAVAPTREMLAQLTNRQWEVIREDHGLYFRDVYDHLIRATEDLDTLRELAAGTLEVYLSQVNNNLSVIMKRLTGVTVVLAGIAAVGGLFGMSEAGGSVLDPGAHLGFWVVTAAIVVGATVTAVVLRRLDWI